MRDLVSMAAAATERCRVWPKNAALDVKRVRMHCCGAGSSRHPTILQVVFSELIHANITRLPRRISLLNVCPSEAYSWCTIPSESKNASFVLLRTWRPFFSCGDMRPFHCDDCCFVNVSYQGLVTCHNVLKKLHVFT